MQTSILSLLSVAFCLAGVNASPLEARQSQNVCAGGEIATVYTTANGDVYGICKNTDFPAGDLGPSVRPIYTAEACADACSNTAGCVAGSLHTDTNRCYLKSKRNNAKTFNIVISVYKIASACPPPY